jgi:hypothetical protein
MVSLDESPIRALDGFPIRCGWYAENLPAVFHKIPLSIEYPLPAMLGKEIHKARVKAKRIREKPAFEAGSILLLCRFPLPTSGR